jgi:hypothetical protein
VASVITWDFDVSTPAQLERMLAVAIASKIFSFCKSAELLNSKRSKELFLVSRPKSKTQAQVSINCNTNYVTSEVFMAVTMKNAVFWHAMPCGSCMN